MKIYNRKSLICQFVRSNVPPHVQTHFKNNLFDVKVKCSHNGIVNVLHNSCLKNNIYLIFLVFFLWLVTKYKFNISIYNTI